MNREEAFSLVSQRIGGTHLMSHSLAAEACMRALAHRLEQDRDLWGLAGLVHDLDLDECGDDMERHALVAAAVLREHGAPEPVIHAVLCHNDKANRSSLMDHALWVVDPTTGMITAAALVRPDKSTRSLELKSIKKRMKDKRFAASVDRSQIRACTELLGLELGEFLEICLRAMDEIRHEIGLG